MNYIDILTEITQHLIHIFMNPITIKFIYENCKLLLRIYTKESYFLVFNLSYNTIPSQCCLLTLIIRKS